MFQYFCCWHSIACGAIFWDLVLRFAIMHIIRHCLFTVRRASFNLHLFVVAWFCNCWFVVYFLWNFPYDFVDPSLINNDVTDPQPSGPIHQVFGTTKVSGVPLKPGDKLRGAFMEYNKSELKERVISDIHHHFNFNPIVFASNSEGFQYKPHYEVEIRAFSNYIESGDPDEVVGVPNYSTYFTDEKTWKWRDMYEIGFIDDGVGVDYPFLNNAHYPKKDITFVVQRQILADGIALSAITASELTIENMVIDGCE